jgi:regulator of sigma E protease
MEPAHDLSVGQVVPGSPAEAAGVRTGDRIVEVDGRPVYNANTFIAYLQANSDQAINVGFERDGANVVLPIKPKIEQDERSGREVARVGIGFSQTYMLIYPNPVEQFRSVLVLTYRGLRGLLDPRSDIRLKDMSGPPGIARAYLALSENIRMVLWLTILINVNLAIFNLFPIPVLDGGHMLFATIGKIRGRALPQKLIIGSQSICIVLLFSLIIYVSSWDLYRWGRDIIAERAETNQTPPANP